MIIHLVLGIFRQNHMLSIRIIWILRLRVSRIFNIFKQSQIDTWELMDIWWCVCVCACKVKDWRAPRERERERKTLSDFGKPPNHQTTNCCYFANLKQSTVDTPFLGQNSKTISGGGRNSSWDYVSSPSGLDWDNRTACRTETREIEYFNGTIQSPSLCKPAWIKRANM